MFNALRNFTKVLIPYLKNASAHYMLYHRMVNILLLVLHSPSDWLLIFCALLSSHS